MVVASPLNLKRVTVSANESKKRVTEARSSVKNIGQILFRRTKVKRDVFAQTNLFRKRREESEKRQFLEGEIEAPRVVVTPSGPQQLTQSAGTGGFLNRILGFIGYLAAGWILNNIPTWIAMGKEFIARIQKAGQIVSGFFNNTIRLFANVGNILGSLGQNLLQFDFFDTSNRVKDAMGNLNLTMENLTSQIEEAFGLLTTPLTEGKYSGEQIPETGTQQTNEGAYGETPPYSRGAFTGTDKAILDLIASVEAGRENYDSVNGGSRTGKPPTQSTIGEIARSGQGATGRYQHMPVYILSRAKSAGFNENTLFTPAVQDKITLKFLEDSHSYAAWKNGKITDRQFAQKLAVTWRGLPYDERNLTYQDQYARYNKAHTTFANVLSKLNASKKSSQQTSMQSPPQATPSRGITPIITSRYGESRGVRTHGGSDLAVKQGTSLRAVSDGVIVDSDYENGWGNFLVMRDNLGIYHLYGHMQSGYKRSGPVKKGEVIGKVGMSGRTSGPHLHWETGTGWNGGVITGKFDPLNKYSKFAPFNTVSEVKMSAPPQQTNMVPLSLTPERRGQDIMIIEPQQQQNIITPVSSGEDVAPSPINDFQLLNNFIKNKLLLDLAYV